MMTHTLRFLACAVLAAIAAIALSGCKPAGAPAYSHFEQIGAEGWDPLDVLVFEPWPEDSLEADHASYSLTLVVRETARMRSKKLPLALMIEDENGEVRRDTLLINTGDDSTGVESHSNYGVREYTLPLSRNTRITPGYIIGISPLVGKESTRGLLNVGIVMEKN